MSLANRHFNKNRTSHLCNPVLLISWLDSYLSSLKQKLLKATGENVHLMQCHTYVICLSNLASLSCTLWRNNGDITKESLLRCDPREPRVFHHSHNYTSLVLC